MRMPVALKASENAFVVTSVFIMKNPRVSLTRWRGVSLTWHSRSAGTHPMSNEPASNQTQSVDV
jgi:hypothetical protein